VCVYVCVCMCVCVCVFNYRTQSCAVVFFFLLSFFLSFFLHCLFVCFAFQVFFYHSFLFFFFFLPTVLLLIKKKHQQQTSKSTTKLPIKKTIYMERSNNVAISRIHSIFSLRFTPDTNQGTGPVSSTNECSSTIV